MEVKIALISLYGLVPLVFYSLGAYLLYKKFKFGEKEHAAIKQQIQEKSLMSRLFKWLTFIIVLFTTIVIPAIFLETPFSRYGETALAWAGENTVYTSIVVMIALAADVFLPVPNGLTNTLAGASLGWALASVVVWIGLNLGAVFGYVVGEICSKTASSKDSWC